MHELDPELPPYNVQSLEEIVDQSVVQPRFESILLSVFAAAALLLAALGIYGVISYSVTQRRQEIGVRIALGAPRAGVLRMVLTEAAALALAGIAIGSAFALAATRVVSSSLQGILPVNVLMFFGIASALLVVALAASSLPAWRAARVDPLIAMRRG